MASSDDEDERLPTEVSDYHFVDSNNEPISFAELPLKLDDDKKSDNEGKGIGLHGRIDNGLQQIFTQVTAWKFDILSHPKPEILVLTRKNNWIKLLKPKKSYEGMIRTILITVHCLNYVQRNPETSGMALWDNLAKVFSLFEPRPSERDLAGHLDLLSDAAERHEKLKRSKVLVTFLEDKPIGKKVSSKELGNTTMSSFIVDNALEENDEIDEDGSDDESEDFFEAVCAICDNGGTILCCEGKCLRSFHATKEAGVESNCDSLGYSEEQFKAMENQTFVCKNCQFKQHQCFVCGKLGTSDKSAGAEVFQCVAGTCGYFYHPNCVAKSLNFNVGDKIKDLEHEIAAGKPFTCPIHFCAVCHGHEPDDKNDELMQFAVCRRCPRAYHRKCLPRAISFEDDEDKDIVQRAWKDLMPNKILIYCLKHKIDDELATPIRNHIKFPNNDQKKEKQTSKFVSKEKVLPKKKVILSKDVAGVKTAPKHLKSSDKSAAVKKSDSTKTNEGQLSMREMPKKRKLANNSSVALKKTLSRKDTADGETTASLGEQLYAYLNKDSDAVKTVKGGTADTKEPKRKGRSIVKDFNDSVRLDDDSHRRILSILNDAESSITIEDVRKKHETPSTHSSSSSKRMLQYLQNMTLGKVEGSTEAIRAALQKLDGGGSLEDAKAVCEPGLLNQITKFRSKLKVYLSPFLHGPRYTSYGRHFTKVDKLQAIVDKLHWYMEDGDMMVDFCCGANDFSWLMKQKMDEMGKSCNFKNYDIIQAKNNFNFERKDWMKVEPSDLPPGSQLIMGLNPPFGANAVLARKFIDRALLFNPKLLILIVPREAGRIGEENPYDLIWEDNKLLGGRAFYLPGSVDVNDKQMDDWNHIPPPLYLWSHRDWTTKHKEIALRRGHLPGVQKMEECHLQRELSVHHEESHDSNRVSGIHDAKKLEVKAEKVTESHLEGGSSLNRGNKKALKDHGLKDQVSGDCGEDNKKKRKRGGVSDKKSLGKRSMPRHSSPATRAGGRPWDLNKHGEMRGEVQREVYQHGEHPNSVSGPQVHMDRVYGDYPDERMARRNNSEDHYLPMGNRWQHPVDPGSDFHLAEQFVDYSRDATSSMMMSQAYAREADMMAEAQYYGRQNPAFAASAHAGAVPGPRFPSTYRHLGATVDSAYNTMHTSAMQRYTPRLDGMNNNMGAMQHLDSRRGMHYMAPPPPPPPPPHPHPHPPGGYPMEFAHGPYPPFSQQSSSGWLND